MGFTVRPRPLRVFLLLLLAYSTPGCTEDRLAETASLERQLLIVWVASERGDTAITREYNARAQRKWAQLRAGYLASPVSRAGARSRSAMDLWMAALDANLRAPTGPASARTYFELLLNEVRTLRPDYGIDHPADQLYGFYQEWERVVEASNDQLMCLLEWPEYVALYETAMGRWAGFRNRPLGYHDGLFPGLSTNGSAAELARLEFGTALDDFGQLLAAADHTLAALPSQRIRHQYFDYLAVLLDYPDARPNQ